MTLRLKLLVACLVGLGVFSAALSGQSIDKDGGSVPPPWYRFGPQMEIRGYVLVQTQAKLECDKQSTGIAELDALGARYGVVSVEPLYVDPPRGHANPGLFHSLGMDRTYFFVFSAPRSDLEEVVASYQDLKMVVAAWQDGIVHHCDTVPDDPDYPNQWNYHSAQMDLEPVWDDLTDCDVLLAVHDTGIDIQHGDIAGNLWVNPGEIPGNGIDDEANGYIDDVNGWDFHFGDNDPDDLYGHGTHVAGTIAAVTNNATQVAGVCWTADVMAVKVLGDSGGGTWAGVAAGIVYSADEGVSVTNHSLGGTGKDNAVESAVQYAAGLDVVQACAAGNNGNQGPFYPAQFPECIAVMATDSSDNRAGFSNYGSWCDLAGPGVSVLSLWDGGGTNTIDGTSMACPHVAGTAALARTVNPMMDMDDVRLAINHSARDAGAPGKDDTYQWGIVNAHSAFDRARSLLISTTTADPGDSVNLSVKIPAAAGDFYLLLMTSSGRSPGIFLRDMYPFDFRYINLNSDFIFQLGLILVNTPGFLDGFLGTLDGNGEAAATFTVPNGPGFSGLDLHFSGITFTDVSVGVGEVMCTQGVSIN